MKRKIIGIFVESSKYLWIFLWVGERKELENKEIKLWLEN